MTQKKNAALLAVLATIAAAIGLPAAGATQEKPNVLFLSVDDLNDWIGCLGGHPQARTPNIDRLAERSVLFTRNYCASPMCNPSRTALFLGRSPETTGVFGNQDEWQKLCPQYTTLAGHFHNNGYYVAGSGKLFHQERNTRDSDWDEYFESFEKHTPTTDCTIREKPLCGIKGYPGFEDWGPLDTPDENMRDMKVANWAASFLERKMDKPFFLGVGIFLPHLPLYAPKKYFDEYPPDQVQMPPIKEDDLDDVPTRGVYFATRDKWSRDIREQNKARENVQAYLACIRFVDVCVGRVLDALDNSPYATNTIIVLWSDHGMQKGEKGSFTKFALWDRSAHCPLLISPAGATNRPNCDRTVNLIDVYPTLIDLCGLPPVPGLEGRSLAALLRNPEMPWDYPSITVNHGDRSVRTERWRYIRYADGGEELYDHKTDPNEWNNLAGNPELSPIKNKLEKYLVK